MRDSGCPGRGVSISVEPHSNMLNRRRLLLTFAALFGGAITRFWRKVMPPVDKTALLPGTVEWPSPVFQPTKGLEGWRRSARRPILASEKTTLQPWLQAIRDGQAVTFRYDSGSQPGARRTVTPALLYTVDGFPEVYVSGYCHQRRAERSFAVARAVVG